MAREQTFLFADLAGFAALTEAHGDADAADVVGRFAGDVRAVLDDFGAHEVKAIGDALMLIAPGATDALRLGLSIANDVGGFHGLPSVRVGMHSGPAIEREGDWFGGTVNVAARVAALAAGDQVLLTEQTRLLAKPLENVELRSMGSKQLRNIAEPLLIYEALRIDRDRPRLPIDPVCRMAVEPSQGAIQLVHEGVEYRFCSLPCAAAFKKRPESYVGPDLDSPERNPR